MEKNSPVFVIRSLFEHGYSPAEAKDTVNLFQNPPNGELILDAVFFSGIHKTLDNEHIDALMTLTPAEKIELESIPSPTAVPAYWLQGAKNAQNLKKLAVKNIKMDPAGCSALISLIKEKPLTELTVSDTDIASRQAVFSDFCSAVSKCETLTSLNVSHNRGQFALMTEKLAKSVKNLPLKELDLSGQLYSNKTFDELPASLESLSIRRMSFSHFPPADLLYSLGKLPNLKSIDAERCYLFNEHFDSFCHALEGTKIERLNLFGAKASSKGDKLSDVSVSALLSVMKKESCLVHDTGLTKPFDHDISPETIKEIAYWENFNADKIEISKNKAAMRDKYENGDRSLFTLAGTGRFEEAFQRAPIAADDFKQTDTAGKALIVRIAESNQLPLVFTPSRLKSAKEMGELWALVPDKFKSQMDGKDGRPSFVKIKQQMMLDAIKNAAVKKSAGR